LSDASVSDVQNQNNRRSVACSERRRSSREDVLLVTDVNLAPMYVNPVQRDVATVIRESTNTSARLVASASAVVQLNVQNDADGDTSGNSEEAVDTAVNVNVAQDRNAHDIASTVTVVLSSTDARLNVNANDANQLVVQVVAETDTRRFTRTSVALNVPANHARRLNVRNDAQGDTSENTNVAVCTSADVNDVNQLAVQNTAHGDTRRFINTDAVSAAYANPANQPVVHDTVNGDTRGSVAITVNTVVNVNDADQLNVQNTVNTDTSRNTTSVDAEPAAHADVARSSSAQQSTVLTDVSTSTTNTDAERAAENVENLTALIQRRLDLAKLESQDTTMINVPSHARSSTGVE